MTAEVKDIIERIKQGNNALVEVKSLSVSITFNLISNALFLEEGCVIMYGEEEMCVEFCLQDIHSIRYIEEVDMEIYTLLFTNGLTITFCF